MTTWGEALQAGPEAYAEWQRKRDQRRVAADRRKPPMPKNPGRGFCSWCTREIIYPPEHKRAGQRNERANWHRECVGFYQVASWQGTAAHAVFQRDRGICALCCTGEPCEDEFAGWRKYPRNAVVTDHGRKWFEKLEPSDDWTGHFSTVEAQYRHTWHADHIVPLWSVAGRELADRGCYWSLVNLWTLCDHHHAEKTRDEAATRALYRRTIGRAS